MKNKFLLFSSLFLFASLVFLIHPQSVLAYGLNPNASTGDSMTLGLTILTTTANASGTVTYTGADTQAGGVGFVFGPNSGFGNYVATSSKFAGYATATDFSWEISAGGTSCLGTCTLSAGTLYYYRAYASNTVSTGYDIGSGGEKSLLTKPVEPATSSLNALSFSDKIKLTWATGTGAEKTVIRYKTDDYPSSITDGDDVYWGSDTEITVYSLNSQRSYYFRAWSSTSDGGKTQQSDSFASIKGVTTAPEGGTGGRTFTSPTTYSDSLIINRGALSTQTKEVTLTLKAVNANLMTICGRSDLLNCSLETYSTTKSWTLTEGDGVKTVYAQFTSTDGVNSKVVSDTITLSTPTPAAPAEPVIPAIPATPAVPAEEPAVPATPATPATPAAPAAKPISEMNKEELTSKIAEILAQVQALQAELSKLKVVVVLEANLKYGNRGDDVVKLQDALIKEGVLPSGLNTGWFGPATKAAVIKFQEKYAVEILVPNGLTKGTGFVGSSTRAKLNELSGK